MSNIPPSQITQRSRLIAYALQFSGDLSNQELADRLDLKPHVVQYTKSQLIDAKIIKQRFYINPYALGLQKYQLLFSSWGKAADDASAIDYLKNHWRTAWFAIIAGQYQYAVNLVASSPKDLANFLDEIEFKYGEVFSSKVVSVLPNFVLISKKYLLTEIDVVPPQVEFIELTESSKPDLDQLDYAIISVLAENPNRSQRELAQLIQVPRSTFNVRLQRLHQIGVLLGNFYFISATKLGRQPFLIQIQTVGARQKVRKAIYAFAKNNPQVVNLAEVIGAWDYQLNLEVQDRQDLNNTIKLLYRASKKTISQITSVAIMEQQQSPLFLGAVLS